MHEDDADILADLSSSQILIVTTLIDLLIDKGLVQRGEVVARYDQLLANAKGNAASISVLQPIVSVLSYLAHDDTRGLSKPSH
ncbi:hypothetical protein [Bosea sp. BIWAKO-01]|uniref:hypothetical protein n=1 Tax=Bosea sp. BIWAKO-01 TaxID=506668 RepID=UPI000853BF3D|nr:hypothetical protein [Bosea sp. BIWAKO-01]GAU85974.1 hypothetical protein BIWAKO_05922 [Bosea sp. BIWAKO-01]